MTTLQGVLAQVRERVDRYTGAPINEQETKAALIEPILRALGWDVEDIEEVRREYKPKSADNPVDYALLILRTPRLFLEAKGLGENLDDRKWANQIMGYAVVAGVQWVVLADGDAYRIYNSHAAVPVEEKLFRTVRISDANSRTAETLGLLSKERMTENWIDALWKAHFVDRQVRAAVQALFSSDPDAALVRLIARRIPALSHSEIKNSLGRVRIHLDFPVEPAAAPGPSAPPRRKVAAELSKLTTVPPEAGGPGEPTPWRDVSLQDLIAAGLIEPPSALEKTYKGHRFTARVEADGRVTFDGKTYESLSASAGMARLSIIGAPPGREYPQTNGWTFWRFKDEDGHIKPLDMLRQRYVATGGVACPDGQDRSSADWKARHGLPCSVRSGSGQVARRARLYGPRGQLTDRLAPCSPAARPR